MRRLLVFIIVVAVAIVGFLFFKGHIGTKETPTEELRMVYSGEITTLNYLTTATTNEFSIAVNLVDPLIEYDKYGMIKPCLAADWEVSQDGLVWTFKLREGVKWVNYKGHEYGEVVAQDFVDGLRYILTSENNSRTANIVYNLIKNAKGYYNKEITDFREVGIKALDKYTLQYTLIEPTPYFLSTLTYVCFFPVNGQFLEETKDRFGTDNTYLLYNGPYILKTFEPQNRRVLEKNDSYWDKDNVHINRIVQTYNKEAAVLAPELFLRGEIDIANISIDILHEWMNDYRKKALIHPNRTNFYSYFYCFNFNPRFSEEYEPENWKIAVNNRNFRKSIFHAFNRVQAMMTEEPYNSRERIINTITPPKFISIRNVDYTQLGNLARFSNNDSYNEKLALKYREKSIEELKGKINFPIKILMPYNTASAEWAKRSQVIEQQLEVLLGVDYIDIIIEPKPPTGFLQRVRRSGNYAFMECNWGPDFADPETYTYPFISEVSFNWIHLAEGYMDKDSSSIYEKLVDKAKNEVLDIEKRYRLFAEAEAFLIAEAFVIPYAVGGGGYISSRLNPFERPYSTFGVSSERFKGQRLMEEPINEEEFNEALRIWELERMKLRSNR